MTETVTASAARGDIFKLLKHVNDDAVPVTITSKGGDGVLLAREEWEQIVETLHVMRLPNAARMLDDIHAIREGDTSKIVRAELTDPDKIAG